MGLGYSSVDRTPKHHAADAGSIPRCGEGFSPRVHFSMQTLTHVRTPVCAMKCINICAHVKDLVVHVIYGNTKTPSIHHKLGRATLSRLSFPGKGQPEFHMEEIPKGQFIRTVLLQLWSPLGTGMLVCSLPLKNSERLATFCTHADQHSTRQRPSLQDTKWQLTRPCARYFENVDV